MQNDRNGKRGFQTHASASANSASVSKAPQTQRVGWNMPSGEYQKPQLIAEPATDRSRTAYTLVAGIVIGLIVGSTWSSVHKNTTGSMPAQTASTTTQKVSQQPASHVDESGATIVTPAIQDPGTSVTITALSIRGPVWAVVYEDNDGVPGRILGAGRFTPDRTSGTIELERMTLPGLTYFVGLTYDSADHTFSTDNNPPILDRDGERILTRFMVQ
ncbi:MAG TPA: hypothetical protein VF803_02680 [Candidatus Paceibacterota bacterium]